MKYIIIISIIIISLISCNKVEKSENKKRVEIILNDKNEDVKVKEYDEDQLKNSALESLKEFYSLPYDENSVKTAYDKFYSSNYKEVLRKTRNINNSEEYAKSDPSLDFEFQTTINKVYDITLDGEKAYIDADSSVYDRMEDRTSKIRQTFTMSYENNKWVIL